MAWRASGNWRCEIASLQSGDNVEIAEFADATINVVLAVRRHKHGGQAPDACRVRGDQVANKLTAAGYEIDAIDVDRKIAIANEKTMNVGGVLDRQVTRFPFRQRHWLAALSLV